MGDEKDTLTQGTETLHFEQGVKDFSKIEMLLEATGGLSLSQVCAVTGLEGSTIQNWVKRGWVAHPIGKRYEEVHIARILIINALKECIKLEHIALLMSYINSTAQGEGGDIIKESELFNYLGEALKRMGQANDHSRGGVEMVAEAVIKDYKGPKPDSRVRIRKALSLMIYACVCTDVKRRTEAMMEQILHELENPDKAPEEVDVEIEQTEVEEQQAESEASLEARKTVSQALREWDISSVERIIIDHEEEDSGNQHSDKAAEKTPNRPWYARKGSK